MGKSKEDLSDRTQIFALRIIKLVDSLPNTISGRAIANQLIRSGTSVAANYRAVKKSRSNKEFISKMHIVLEEADETQFWLEIIIKSKLTKESLIKDLQNEAHELTCIFVKALKTMKDKKQ